MPAELPAHRSSCSSSGSGTRPGPRGLEAQPAPALPLLIQESGFEQCGKATCSAGPGRDQSTRLKPELEQRFLGDVLAQSPAPAQARSVLLKLRKVVSRQLGKGLPITLGHLANPPPFLRFREHAGLGILAPAAPAGTLLWPKAPVTVLI